MPSVAALAIVSTAFVGMASVIGGMWGVSETIRAQDRRELIAAQREAYAHFVSVEASTFELCLMHRSEGCPENPARQAALEQGFREMHGAYGAVLLGGGTRLGVLALEVIKKIRQYHAASVPGMSPAEDFQTLDAYSATSARLSQAMGIQLGMKAISPIKPREWRGLMWPAG